MVTRTKRPGRARIRLPVGPFLDALLAGDEAEALRLALDSLALVGSRVGLLSDLVQPAQNEVGELWYAGRLEVADEHRATRIVEAIVDALPPTPEDDPVPPGSRCLLAALGEEEHVLGMRAFALALEDAGWTSDWLGSRVPLARLLEVVQARPPQVVALGAAYLPDPEPLRLAIERLHRARVKVLVGGPAFNRAPGLWKRLGADASGNDARVSLVLARRLLAA